MTILLTTHYLDEAERLCDRVAIMHAGRIVALDTPGGAARRPRRRDRRAARRRRPGAALASLRARGIAGDDAFAVGATLTVPAARPRRGARRSPRSHELGLARRLDQRPPADPRRRLPAPDRRPPRRRRLTRAKGATDMATSAPKPHCLAARVSHAARSRRSRRSPPALPAQRPHAARAARAAAHADPVRARDRARARSRRCTRRRSTTRRSSPSARSAC